MKALWSWIRCHLRRDRVQRDTLSELGEWEVHLCELPDEAYISMLNQVWGCGCGRRWELEEIRYNQRNQPCEMVWSELDAVNEPTDEQIEAFLRGEEAA